ncbi:ATP-dependent Clp protease ATP-binding subunit [Candidatus Saccharibacteria bacterium]|nr:ATP-dependent Clp protease ATP-binding subunit [Candidatus Saccharibacteria bacterium]
MNHPEALQFFIDHISEETRQVFLNADQIAKNTGHPMLLPEHLTLGILSLGQSDGAAALNSIGITFTNFRDAFTKNCPGEASLRPSLFSTIPEETLQIFRHLAERGPQPGSPLFALDLLIGIFVSPSPLTQSILRELGLTENDVLEAINFVNSPEPQDNPILEPNPEQSHNKKTALERFTVNLTARAASASLDPVIGRDAEIHRLRTILLRRQKNNPLLIGEPGVGKTAIVEGLAASLAASNQPHSIYQLDFIALIAGTSYHGEFERRMQGVLTELEATDHPILFLDEGHLITAVGGGGDGIDLANLLKPALARGKLSVIAATTLIEYRKSIERDKALRRRFQPITITAPDLATTETILRGIKTSYESHHQLQIPDNIIHTTVCLADRFIKSSQFPDRALDLLDEAAALARLETETTSPSPSLTRLKSDQDALVGKLQHAISTEDYELAAKCKSESLRLCRAITSAEKRGKTKAKTTTLTLDHITRTVSIRTGLPVSQISQTAEATLLDLETRLSRRLVGQPEAIATVARLVRRSQSGLSDPRRPLGSAIFLGPTGVGKTELARHLTEELWGSQKHLIKLDMSEFVEKHTVSRLIGAPAGYVGYEDGGALTERVKHQPNSLILFDEIEKAHAEVYNLLLQILEDGQLTASDGESVSFANTFIILTSNLGQSDKSDRSLGFGDGLAPAQELTEFALHKTMKPELLSRFDEIVTFNRLDDSHASEIFDLQVAELDSRLRPRGLTLRILPSAKAWIIAQGWSQKSGARSLRQALEKHLIAPLADYLIAHQPKDRTLSVSHKKSAPTIDICH